MIVTGGRLCKAVRYEIASEPIATRTCWCRLCQYIGAGSATVNAAFHKGALAISGEVRDYRSVADSGSVIVAFAPHAERICSARRSPARISFSFAPARWTIPNSHVP